MLCWKIRVGIERGVSYARIADYVRHVAQYALIPHFACEEEHVFPVLGGSHPMVQQALEEHRALRLAWEGALNDGIAIHAFALALDAHIRFEERVLFSEVERTATPEEFKKIVFAHDLPLTEPPWNDRFWAKATF